MYLLVAAAEVAVEDALLEAEAAGRSVAEVIPFLAPVAALGHPR